MNSQNSPYTSYQLINADLFAMRKGLDHAEIVDTGISVTALTATPAGANFQELALDLFSKSGKSKHSIAYLMIGTLVSEINAGKTTTDKAMARFSAALGK